MKVYINVYANDVNIDRAIMLKEIKNKKRYLNYRGVFRSKEDAEAVCAKDAGHLGVFEIEIPVEQSSEVKK